jgi:hypothetical protein
MEPDRTLGEVFDDVADHCEEAREGYSAEIVGRGQRDYFRLGSYAVSILSGLVRSPDLSPVVKVATAARGCGFVRGQVQAMRFVFPPGADPTSAITRQESGGESARGGAAHPRVEVRLACSAARDQS